MSIVFGTDGWRGITAEDFTFDNVRLCAQGTVDLLRSQGNRHRGLVIGYDTRFGSERFASAVAEVAAGNLTTAILCDRPAPTPAVAHNLVARDAAGGVVITASHNAAEWNGYKYKPDYGGSASEEVVGQLEERIAAAARAGPPASMTIEEGVNKGLVEYLDPEPSYLGHLTTLVDIDGIRSSGLKIVADPMHGAGGGYFDKLLSGGSASISEVRGERNPAFPGMSQPEPIARNLAPLVTSVRTQGADVGLATDGDADRLGVVDDTGRCITTLQAFALLCMHQLDVLKNTGPIVRSITMTNMVNRLAEPHGVRVFKTPVGFKHLAPVMIQQRALLAGEESGGYAFRGSVPERDGILSGLMVLDLMVRTGKTVSELLRLLEERVGPHHYDRRDLTLDRAQRMSAVTRLSSAQPQTLAGKRIESVDTQDGFHYVLEDGYWAMIRFSGTEPLLRIYAEAESPEAVTRLLDEASALAGV